MNINKTSAIVVIVATTFLAGCQTAQEKEFAKNTTELNHLDPMSKPIYTQGESFNYIDLLNDSEVITSNTVAVSDTGATFLNSKGCEYVDTGPLKASVSWKNCNGNGSATVETTGNIWPLQVGNTESQKIIGIHNGESWGGTNLCEVVSAQSIVLQAKNFDTFKVVCKRGKRVKTYFMAANIKQPLVYTYKVSGQSRRNMQLVVSQ